MTDNLILKLRDALDMAERIMHRDGVQALRGEAWVDGELELISEARQAVKYHLMCEMDADDVDIVVG